MQARDGGSVSPTFGERLRQLRGAAGLTQEELAERAGLTVYGVGALERGNRTRPYPHTVRALAAALDLDDEQRRALFGVLVDRRPGPPSPAPRRADAPDDDQPGDLRPAAQPTPLHGRAADLARLTELIRHDRLVTLTGPGGVGKTRLAVELAHRLAPDHVHGALLVELAHVRTAPELVTEAARALAVPAADTLTTAGDLAEALGDRQVLLVLDNLEQVAGAAAEVAALVAGARGLHVVATSRAPLRVRAERVHVVEPLSVPEARPSTLDALGARAAGAMLVERVRATAPVPGLTDADAADLAELARRVAGLPLALELLAPAVGTLGAPAVVERLSDILARADLADLPERHRTLRAALEWSRQLLDETAVRLLVRLAVFQGGFTLAAAESVDPAPGTWSTLDGLVHQSLVHRHSTADGGQRYRMLQPVAEWARDLLGPDALAEARAAHAAWALRLTEEAAPEYTRADQVRWLTSLDAEDANLAAALDWMLGDGADPEAAARMGWALWLFWWLRGRLRSGREAMARALASPLPPVVEGRARLTYAAMSLAMGDLDESSAAWQRAQAVADAADDLPAGASARAGRALVLMQTGLLDEAEDCLRDALTLTASGRAGWAGDWVAGLAEIWLGTIERARGDGPAARGHLERGLARAAGRGDRLTAYIALFNLAQLELGAGDARTAQRHLEEAVRLTVETRDAANLGFVAEAWAVAAAQHGDVERVPVLMGAAEALRAEAGGRVYGYYLPDQEEHDRAVAAARAVLGGDRYDDLVDQGRGLGFDEVVGELLGAGG